MVRVLAVGGAVMSSIIVRVHCISGLPGQFDTREEALEAWHKHSMTAIAELKRERAELKAELGKLKALAAHPLAAATHFRPDLSPKQVNCDLESLARYIGKACDCYRALEETMRALGISGGDRMHKLSDAVHGCAQIARLLGYPTPADKENGGG